MVEMSTQETKEVEKNVFFARSEFVKIRPHRLSVSGVRRALLGGCFFARAWLWLSGRATEESVLEVHVWMIFRTSCLQGHWRESVLALIIARLQGHWGQRFGSVFLDCFFAIMDPKVDEVGPKMAPTQP